MTDFRTATSIGERIRAARKDRGFRTPAELSAAIPGGVVKESTIQNVEAGRKAELTVSQLLNISLALRLPPAFLLAPLGRLDDKLDLANLSDDFQSMTTAEFESWLSGTTPGAYRVTTAAEHRDRHQLQAIRELGTNIRERDRLTKVLELEAELDSSAYDVGRHPGSTTSSRLKESKRRITELTAYLVSSGLEADGWEIHLSQSEDEKENP